MIAEGPVALNKFISNGGIEELKDVIPPSDDEKNYESDSSGDQDERDPKRQKRERLRDHNAELIFDKDTSASSQKAFIPPLMALNVQVKSKSDQDFRMNNVNQNGDRDDRDVWQSNNQWNQNSMNNNSNSNMNMPPSLLNININPPNMGSNFRNQSRGEESQKGRRRDSEGRRISRFDSIDSRNKRLSIPENENNGGSGSSSSGGGGNFNNRNSSGRNRRR